MKTTWQEKLRYRFDNFMSRGTAALIGGLALLSVTLIVIFAAIISTTRIAPANGEPVGFLEAAWLSLMRTLDAGTMGGDEGWGFRLIMFVVTLGGVFIISTLIGVLTSGIEAKMDELRKGRSRVIEKDHTVILGWSPQVFTVLPELIQANANQSDPCVVILGDKDKVEMEDEIRTLVGPTGKTRVVCRTGSPIDMNDLDLVSLQSSRSIIILTPAGDDSDAETIKTILAITNSPNRRSEPYHIVAEIQNQRNIDIAKMVGKDEVELVLTGNLISRIIAQTCRQSGLSIVYTELLDFGGDEIYFKEEPALVGKTFRTALDAYNDSTVLGLWKPENGSQLNPAMDYVIQSGEKIIAISADDDTIVLNSQHQINRQTEAILPITQYEPVAERTLILGWNQRAMSIIGELDLYVAPGSEIVIVANDPDAKQPLADACQNCRNQSVRFIEADTTERTVLESIQPETFNHVIVLSYANLRDTQAADACTLMTLLHLRDMAEKGNLDLAIVSEMQDVRNRALAEVTQADDFIVSNRLVSLILSQISENKALNSVFTDIFDADGSEIYLKPISHYITPGVPVNFYTVIEAAAQRGEVAFGYRRKALSAIANQSYGVVVNPVKTDLVTFDKGDTLILLAED